MTDEVPHDPPALTPELLIAAYSEGFFPMAERRDGPLVWCNPDPRAILPLSPAAAFHIPHGLRRRLKKNPFVITLDQAFARVISACAQPRPREKETWINAEIMRAYTDLHRLGLAHSVEAWAGEDSSQRSESGDRYPTANLQPHPSNLRLVGGLYGVALGGAFFGESMFSLVTDASKICLVRLTEHLRQRGYALLDAQFSNPHLEQFGLLEIPRSEYLDRLKEAIHKAVTWE